MSFAPGDIIAIRGRGWLSDHIVLMTGPATHNGIAYEVSHVGLVTATEPCVQVTEALTRVKTNPLDVTLKNCERAWVLSHPSLSTDQRLALALRALRFTADDYGYFDILLQYGNAVFGTRWFTDHLYWSADKTPICSYLVAKVYDDELQEKFGKNNLSATPKDVMQYTLDKSWQMGMLG